MAFRLILLTLMTLLIGTSPVMAGKPDHGDHPKKAQRFEKAIGKTIQAYRQQGFKVILKIDHAANAASVHLDLRPTQLIVFGHPRREVELLRKSSTVGIDLPVKVLVWEDKDGVVRRTFNSSGYLIDRHGLKVGPALLRSSATAQSKLDKADTGLITVNSTQSFQNTVDSLLAAIQNAPPPGPPSGFSVPLVRDYSDFKRRIKGRRPPVLIAFGNPLVGTPLMQEQQSMGIDLPQKFLVWEDGRHRVHITYNDPHFLAERHGVVGQDERLDGIAKALATLAAYGANL